MLKRIPLCIVILRFLVPLNYAYIQEKKPLKMEDVENFLKSGLFSSKAIVNLIKERGIDFVAGEEELTDLRKWGADESVIAALKEAGAVYESKTLGDLIVESIPPGAKVRLDDHVLDQRTPLSIPRLSPGKKKLVVWGLESYGEYEGAILIEPAKTIRVRVELPPLYSLMISTEPAKASIFLTGDKYQGQNIGETESQRPCIVKDLKGGEYTIEVRKDGYQTVKDKLILNKDASLNYVLDKIAVLPVEEEIRAKMIEAQGGRRALEYIRDSTIRATIEMVKVGIKGEVIIYQKEPNKVRIDIEIAGMTVTQAFDGEKAWWLNPATGKTEEMPASSAQDMKRQAFGYDAILNPAKYQILYTYKGKERIEDKDCFILEQRFSEGRSVTMYVNTLTYLLYKSKTDAADQSGGKVVSETEMSDYRKVGDIIVSHSMTVNLAGELYTRMTVNKVEFNSSLPDSLFQRR